MPALLGLTEVGKKFVIYYTLRAIAIIASEITDILKFHHSEYPRIYGWSV
jgi:hypothetical protein